MHTKKAFNLGNISAIELTIAFALIVFFITSIFQSSNLSRASESTSITIQNLASIHSDIDSLPIDPAVRQQMLKFIEIAESQISLDDMAAAREAVLDFCRRIEWFRYQIGHNKIDNLFNQAMDIAVDLHNASLE